MNFVEEKRLARDLWIRRVETGFEIRCEPAEDPPMTIWFHEITAREMARFILGISDCACNY